jgi:hypothetical protein
MIRWTVPSLLILGAWPPFVPPAAAELPRELERWLGPQSWQRDVDGPVISLGGAGEFDDRHIFAPAVVHEEGRFLMWYSGSRGNPGSRVFRLGQASSEDGQRFLKYAGNPVLGMSDNAHSVLTPALLRHPDGSVLREAGKLRLWFAAATLGKGGVHTLHEATSTDGLTWSEPSPVLLENVYCPTVLKQGGGYQMWYSDVSRRPWVIRHAASPDGRQWTPTERPVLRLGQDWEGEVLVYPAVLMVDDVYLMWYGSYDRAIRRETTAIGFAVSKDGLVWHKHPQNPVLRPDPKRAWESNYVGSGSVLRLADGSFRYWYASRKQPPFENLYFAINTARWAGPPVDAANEPAELPQPVRDYLARCRTAGVAALPLRLPPQTGDVGIFEPPSEKDARRGRSVDVLEIVDERSAIVRAWYASPGEKEPTFADLWLQGIETAGLAAGRPAKLPQVFHVTGSKLIDTTCGRRSFPLLEAVDLQPRS